LNNKCVKLAIHFSLEAKIGKDFLKLSKLATQMVTSTPLENLSLLLYEPQNKNFNFGTTKTLILHAQSIFFRGGHITKIWSKNIFFHENPVEVRSFDGISLIVKKDRQLIFKLL
jgi:hypothetical protein